MHYPTLQHIEAIIRWLNHTRDARIVIINKGQLEFALKKPQMVLYGNEQYPELYQKAAALMETITKAHTLSDGNKRVAMITASTMIRINGGHLILPLKSIRLSVDTAMDSDDVMSDIIRQWFKVHTATNMCSLCSMLAELDEEESIIRELLVQGKEDEADRLLDGWMAFDNYPDNKKACGDLITSWKKIQEVNDISRTANDDTDGWPLMWDRFASSKDLPHGRMEHPAYHVGDPRRLRYRRNSMAELKGVEERIRVETAKCEKSEDASFVLQNALRLESYGMYGHAVSMFERLRVLDEDESHAVSHIAKIKLYGMNDAKSALKYFEMYLGYHPDEDDANLHAGLALMKLGRYPDALARLANLPDDYPGIGVHRGRAHSGMGEHDSAIKLYRNALRINPRDAYAHGLMGVSYSRMGDDLRALECYDKAIEIERNHMGYYNKGLTLGEMGRYDEAIENYRMALGINPHHLESRINLASTLSESGKPEEAIPHFLGALDVDPNRFIALYSLAVTFSRVGRYQEALGCVDKAVEMHPSKADAKYLRAKILAAVGRTVDVLEILASLRRSDPALIDSANLREDFESLLPDKKFEDWLEGHDGRAPAGKDRPARAG